MDMLAQAAALFPASHSAQRLLQLRVEAEDDRCVDADDTNDSSLLDGMQFIAVILLLLLGLGCGFATAYDFFTRSWPRRNELLVAFSLYTNGEAILLMGVEGRDTLPPLHGMRVCAMFMVVMAHRFLWALSTGMAANTHYMEEIWKSPVSLLLKLCIFSVDIFLMLSGLLVTYVVCNHRSEGKPFYWSAFYFHRFLRLTPLLIMVLLLQSTLLPLLGDGPIWQQYVVCDIPWWSIVTFTSNFYDLHRCVGYTWYVAADSQLYFMAPPLLALLLWRPRPALRLMTLLIVVGVVGRFFVARAHGITVSTGVFGGGTSKAGKMTLFQNPFCRFPTFVMGMILGYKLHILKYGKARSFVSLKTLFLWSLVFILFASTFYSVHVFSQLDNEYHTFWDPFVLATGNTAFGLACCILLYLCCTGRGGVLGMLMSWSVWQPLSRLTYTVYMVHVSVVLWSTGTIRRPITITAFNTFREGMTDYVTAVVFAVPFALLFESPVVQVERLLLAREIKSQRAKSNKSMDGSLSVRTASRWTKKNGDIKCLQDA